ncbi:hypothetical protein [Kutzneria sp. 744]|uniref:hypothetical protein n=1 Tax=Kutzneria sp. (strain 744) TaxID=345341 RepID=UPI0003EEB4A3|nr:hypothetical protein [Kutzneria sp. 744]EWM19698.1 hypothetical protein KUTG_10002 [Kutzneria sp. 744]
MTDKTVRVVGYTELWERMRRVLAVEGDQTYVGWIESEPPPAYFGQDGQPDMLFGHVLAGLGTTPEQVTADLLPHNESEPRTIFAAAGFPLTVEAGWLAEGVWIYEMRSVYWTRCIGKREDHTADKPDWVTQDAVPLAEIEGTSGEVPVDVTAITAAVPTTRPSAMTISWARQIGYNVWMRAAEQAGEGTTWTVTRATFDVDSVPVDASAADDNVCAAILVDHRWYVIERCGDTVRARLVPIDGHDD